MRYLLIKSVFNPEDQKDLIERIQQLKSDDLAQWGTMNVFQMLGHMTIWNQWVLGIDNQIPYKQSLLGKILGKWVLKSFVKDNKPVGKNAPAGSEFTTDQKHGDLEKERGRFIELIKKYQEFDNPDYKHNFFGKMTNAQLGVLVYKHIDHHLRQFGK